MILGRWKNDWQDTEYILRLFGKKVGSARRKYSEFIKKSIEQGKRPDLIGGGLLRSHGGWSGVRSMAKAGEYQKGDEILDGVRDKKRTDARSILVHWATDQLGITQVKLAQKLNLTQSAISHDARRERILAKTINIL